MKPLLFPLLFAASTAFAQAPATPAPAAPPPKPQILRTVPPPGIAISTADRAELTAGVAALGKEIASLEKDLAGKPELLALLPDVQIFHKSVDWALRYDEFFSPGEIAQARQQLEMGMARAAELRKGEASWNAISGADTKPTADGKDKLPALVVRGYQSKIDGSIQPYGVVLPEDFKPGDNKLRPLHFWCHGRGEKLSELGFINQRLTSKGDYTPPGAFVIHLYGRYCCANKFAGEVDLFEAMENAAKRYPIDPARLVVRGFSMGGGACWQFGTHFAGLWACVQPGAGFGESKEFLQLGTTPDKPMPPEWEQKLWAWYDSTDYVANLANTTTVIYSGEIDHQKQAADEMIRAARVEAGRANAPLGEFGKVAPGDGSPKAEEARVAGTGDIVMDQVIALQTPHKVVEPAKTEVEKLVQAAVEKRVTWDKPVDGIVLPHNEWETKRLHLTTYSLIYPHMGYVLIAGMEKQWERADVSAEVDNNGVLTVTTKNVRDLLLGPVSWNKGPVGSLPRTCKKIIVDGQDVTPASYSSTIGNARVMKVNATWRGEMEDPQGGNYFKDAAIPDAQTYAASLSKRPGVCGPIDHAFMSSFVFVRPTGKPMNKVVSDWVESELGHAVAQWRAVFRGEARVVADTAVSADDIANSNLILWGDPSSNAVLKKIADKLPVKWDGKQLVFAGKTYDAAHVAPVLVFPNPLNPQKYVVLNSGFTFREFAALNNANQTPKLPDWAIVDLNTPPDAYYPGKILRAGFFDEQWQPPTQ